MEKHKDYVLRARDYHKKANALKVLKQKATFRNPDEFYFGMIQSGTKKGVHVQKRAEAFDSDLLQLLKTQDQNYIAYKKSINLKKLEKLSQGLHLTTQETSEQQRQKHTLFVDSPLEGKSFSIIAFDE